jgi:hypothetical protein
LARWLDAHPDADLTTAGQELRRLYKNLFGQLYRLPQRADGVHCSLPPMSEHALAVLSMPVRRSQRHRKGCLGDCVAVSVATALRISYAEAVAICGTRGSLSVPELVPRLEAAGYSVQKVPSLSAAFRCGSRFCRLCRPGRWGRLWAQGTEDPRRERKAETGTHQEFQEHADRRVRHRGGRWD